MQYFIGVVDFVDRNLLWVLVAFLVAVATEAVVLWIKGFNLDKFYILVVTDIIAILGLYVLACLGVGLVNCIRDQDWNFAHNYYDIFIHTEFAQILFIALAVIGAIASFFVYRMGFGWWQILLAAATGAVIYFLGMYALGFVVYVILDFIWIVLKVLWFVISGFFVSIFQFVVKYWLWAIIIIVTPGLIYGMVKSLINYISSMKEEIHSGYNEKYDG